MLGSQDAGYTILEGSSIAQQAVNSLAKTLNLKRHRVKDGNDMVHWLSGPCDLEVHQGPQGRLYAVDFARLFPPEPPGLFYSNNNNNKLSKQDDGEEDEHQKCLAPHLVRLLRPELVRMNSNALSADAFSLFGALDREENDREVLHCGIKLRDVLIPKAAQVLSSMEVVDVGQLARDILRWTAMQDSEDELDHHHNHATASAVGGDMDAISPQTRDWVASVSQNGKQIALVLHKHGVNMRHLGSVFTACVSAKWQKQILNEAVARCVKAKVKAAMRQTMKCVRVAALTPFANAVEDQLNLTLGMPPCTKPLQCDCACMCVCTCIGGQHTYDFDQAAVAARGKSNWWCNTLPRMLCERFGFYNIRDSLLLNSHSTARCHCCACGFTRYLSRSVICARVSESCGLVMSPLLCSSLLVALTQSSPFSYRGVRSPSVVTSPNSTAFALESIFDLEMPFDEGFIVDVLGSVQMLPWLDYATGTALLIKARETFNIGSLAEARRLAKTAKESFDLGLAQRPTDPRMLCNLAFLLEDIFGEVDEARRLYELSVSRNPRHARSHYYLALSLLRNVTQQRRGSDKYRKMLQQIERHFCLAIESSPRENANIVKDYARFKMYQRNDLVGAELLLNKALRVEPQHLRAHELLGNLLEKQQNFARASEVYCTYANIPHSQAAESILGQVYYVRTLLRLHYVDQVANEQAPKLLDSIAQVRFTTKAERPNTYWAVKSTKLMVEIAQDIAVQQQHCSALVHDLFDAASHLFSFYPAYHNTFTQSPHARMSFMERTLTRRGAELRRAHVHVLQVHAGHVGFCDCEDMDHRGLADELHDLAVQVDPTTSATAWKRDQFRHGTLEGFENASYLVLGSSPSSSRGEDSAIKVVPDAPWRNAVMQTMHTVGIKPKEPLNVVMTPPPQVQPMNKTWPEPPVWDTPPSPTRTTVAPVATVWNNRSGPRISQTLFPPGSSNNKS